MDIKKEQEKLNPWGMPALHRVLGFILFFPILIWVVTGIFFFVKPDFIYKAAFERLYIKQYPIEKGLKLNLENIEGHEFKVVRTILGTHLLIRFPNPDFNQNLNAYTLEKFPKPQGHELKKLLDDALKNSKHLNHEYIVSPDEIGGITQTGRRIGIDWDSLIIAQKGQDTRLINTIYRLHYMDFLAPDKGKEHKYENYYLRLLFPVILLLFLLILALTGARFLFLHWKTYHSPSARKRRALQSYSEDSSEP